MDPTTNLGLTLVKQNQAQKELTVNQSLITIDALLNTGVIDKDLTTPPGSPADADLYIVAASATGAWAGKSGQLAYFDQEWKFIVPNEGVTLWVNDENLLYTWDGSAWTGAGVDALDELADVTITSPTNYQLLQYNGSVWVNITNLDNLPQLGVNASSDGTNKLVVASSAVLFNNIGNHIQIKVNKNTASDTASYLFQTGFSGRAEFGLIGDDHFQLKVSADGSTFYQSFVVDKSTGNIAFKKDIACEDHLLTRPEIKDYAETFNSIGSKPNALDRDAVCLAQVRTGAGNLTLNGVDVSSGTATFDVPRKVTVYSAGNLSSVYFTIYGTDETGASINETFYGPGTGLTITSTNWYKTITQIAVDATLGTNAEVGKSKGLIMLDLEQGNVAQVTIGADTVFSFTNPPATGKAGSFTLILKQDGTGGHAVTWPSSVDWSAATAPTLTVATNAVDVLTFLTVDAGSIWYGFMAGGDLR